MSKIFTIGHSTKTRKELIERLKDFEIAFLVDVRSIPFSKYNPQFNRNNDFINELKSNGITYVFKGANLGGLKTNVDYDETIKEVAMKVEQGKKICVMCSEAEPEKCHRMSKLEPSFKSEGLEVIHIRWQNDKKYDSMFMVSLF